MALLKPVNENLLYKSTHAYNHIVQQAHQNSLQTHPDGIFDYEGEEKLRILYHKKSTDQSLPNIFESKYPGMLKTGLFSRDQKDSQDHDEAQDRCAPIFLSKPNKTNHKHTKPSHILL